MATHSLTHEENDLEDSQLWVSLIGGTAKGLPIAFVVAFVVASFAAPWPGSLWIAAWGALIAGPFVGALVTLIAQAAHEDARAHVATPKPAEPALKGSRPRLA
jgi:hypothetical protein